MQVVQRRNFEEELKQKFPKLEIRSYQLEAWQKLSGARENGVERALLQLATGLGKTSVATVDALRYLDENKGARILFVVHMSDIVTQARKTFQQFDPKLRTCIFKPQTKDVHHANAVFTTFQSLLVSLDKFPRDYFDYIIYDETHHIEAETFKKVRDYFKPKFVLGLTATPSRADGLDIISYFGPPIYRKTFVEAMVEGWLVKVKYRLLFDDEIKKAVRDEFNLSSMQRIRNLFNVTPRNSVIAENVKRERHKIGLDNAKTIVFCNNVSHAKDMAVLLGGVAYHARLSDGERASILSKFRSGEYQLICTVNTFNEGMDIPDARLLVFLRSTSSRTIFEQQLGRGLRRAPGKSSVTVLDFVANVDRLKYVRALGSSYVHVRDSLPRENDVLGREDVLFDFGSKFTFDETVINLLDRLDELDNNYPPLPEEYILFNHAAKLLNTSHHTLRRFVREVNLTLPQFIDGRIVIGISPEKFKEIKVGFEEWKSKPQPSRTNEIVSLYQELGNFTAVGKHFGISGTAVRKHLTKAGAYTKKFYSLEKIEKEYLKSMSVKDTAIKLGLERSSVRERLKKAGYSFEKKIVTDSLIVSEYERLGYPAIKTLGAQLHINPRLISKVLKDHGLLKNRVTSTEANEANEAKLQEAYTKYDGDIRLIVKAISPNSWTTVYKALDKYGYLKPGGKITSAQACAALYKYGGTKAGEILGVSHTYVYKLSKDGLFLRKGKRK